MELQTVISILGWIGAGCSLVAYFLVSQKRIAPDSLKYQGLNIIAATLLCLACMWTSAWPSFVTNLIFLFIGLHMVVVTKRAIVAHMMKRAGHTVAEAPLRVGRRVGAGSRRAIAAIPRKMSFRSVREHELALLEAEVDAARVQAQAKDLGFSTLETEVHPITGMILLVEREDCAGEIDAERAGAVIEQKIEGAVSLSLADDVAGAHKLKIA